jgi:prepilin-type N-terminal cleavage/methylation domain-containing protein
MLNHQHHQVVVINQAILNRGVIMRNNKGFTLIEVIISIAIVGIISIPILGIFGTGIKNIVRAGERTEDVFVEQKIINEKMQDYDEGEETIISVRFPDGLEIDVEGKIITSLEDGELLKTFVPKK